MMAVQLVVSRADTRASVACHRQVAEYLPSMQPSSVLDQSKSPGDRREAFAGELVRMAVLAACPPGR